MLAMSLKLEESGSKIYLLTDWTGALTPNERVYKYIGAGTMGAHAPSKIWLDIVEVGRTIL